MIKASRFFKSVEFILFAAVFVTYAYFYPGSGHNENSRFDPIRAVLEEKRLIVDTFAYNSADLISVNGHSYGGKAPGLSILGVPFFAAFNKTLSLFPIGVDLRYHLTCYLTSLFTVGLLSALMSLFIFRYVKMNLGGTDIESVIVALTISFATILFPFSIVFFSHVATAALGFIAFYLIQKINLQNRTRALRSVLFAGFLLGFIIVVEFPAAMISVIVSLYTLVRLAQIKRTRWVLAFIVIGVLGLAPLFLYNLAAFGKLFFISYEAYKADPHTAFQAQRLGLYGIRYEFWDPAFLKQFFGNLYRITVLPLRGIFYLNPILLLVPAGFVYAVRTKWRTHKADVLVSAALLVCFFGMTSAFGDSIVYWGGGASFGPRYVIPALPFLALPLFFAVREMKTRFAFPALAFLSGFFCLMAAAIEPRTPYAPENPIVEFYLPKFVNGFFSQSPDGVFSQVPVIGTSVAFNWGKLIHLPGAFELYPLFAIWIFAAYLIKKRTLNGSFFKAVILFCGVLAFLSGASAFRI